MKICGRSGWRAMFVAAFAWASLVAGARADFTADTLVSGSSTVEADYAFDPAISADGRYVAFTGSEVGVMGLYRKDLQTGALDLVAAGDAAAASISADGRFVSFTTTAIDPSTGAGTQCSSVYVRDMTLDPTAAGAYMLASALDGTTTGLSYAGSGSAGCPGGGSSAAPRVALSADGSEVAFTVVGSSNLTTGANGQTTTPPAQVVVRNLTTLSTTLVSQTMASLGGVPQPVPTGAAMTDNSTGFGATAGSKNADAGDSTAAISADGTTVAWLGINIPLQAPADASDAPLYGHPDEYDEPLWRRIADGPAAPTRRVIGGDDPTGPCPGGCVGPLDTQWSLQSDPTNLGPERGSFIAYAGFLPATSTSASSLSSATPQLSADGQTVAILSTQPATGQDPVYGPTNTPVNVSTNAYVVNMAPGLSRSEALTRLTAWASSNFDSIPPAGPITGIAISPEGDRVAFLTARSMFPYSPPALITPQLSQVAFPQLYVADLAAGTLQLASVGYDGQPANGHVASPSFSANGGPISFSSAASNLVYGSYSTTSGGDQAFITTEVNPPALPGVQTIGPAPANPSFAPAWVISATVRRGPGGSVLVDVSIPGAGQLRAAARAAVPTSTKFASKASRRHARRRGGVAMRTLADAAAATPAAGTAELRLRPAARYRPFIARTHGLYATVTVRFLDPGHPMLTETVPVDFLPAPKSSKKKAVRAR